MRMLYSWPESRGRGETELSIGRVKKITFRHDGFVANEENLSFINVQFEKKLLEIQDLIFDLSQMQKAVGGRVMVGLLDR